MFKTEELIKFGQDRLSVATFQDGFNSFYFEYIAIEVYVAMRAEIILQKIVSHQKLIG